MRSIVRRDTGESYQQLQERLAKASGIATPTRQDLAQVDRDRQGKGSNGDWQHPHDPEHLRTARLDRGLREQTWNLLTTDNTTLAS
ncbi:MAG: hypothetical protein JOZ15_20305 [Acidobacteria bacterium]|nr:hypothetical protein [Acidobacteriota bacterium]